MRWSSVKCCLLGYYNQDPTGGQANSTGHAWDWVPHLSIMGGEELRRPCLSSRIYWLLKAAEGGEVIFSSGVANGKLPCSNKQPIHASVSKVK